MHNERVAGGLRCSEVLGMLSEYADGELGPETRERIEAHLAECDNCLRFGGSFQQLLSAMAANRAPVEPPTAVLDRLALRLSESLPEG